MNEIAPRAEAAPAKAAPDAQQPNPLKQLPKEWRPVVSFFWAATEGLLKSPLELTTRLRLWMDPKESIGLTLDELKPVLKGLLHPSALARFEFGTQLMAELSRRVALAVQRREKFEAPSRPTTQEELARMEVLLERFSKTRNLFAVPGKKS